MNNQQKFYLYTAGSWMILGIISAWLLSNQIRFYLINGYVVLAFIGLIGSLVISKAQCLVINCHKFAFWFLSTLAGLIIGSSGVVFAYFIAYLPVFTLRIGTPLMEWLIWLAYLTLLSALGGAAGGLLAGIFAHLAFEKGSIISWVGISLVNWAVSAAAVGLLAELLRHPDYFGLAILHIVPLSIKAVPIFIIVGLIQSGIMSPRLKGLELISP
jgi:hypothetical protein